MNLDVQTIDAMTCINFRDTAAKECWNSLIDCEYFSSSQAKSTMDFARRWAKVMQHLMKNDAKSLTEVVLPAAIEANIDNANIHAKDMALELLIAVWSKGDDLSRWSSKSENMYDFLIRI